MDIKSVPFRHLSCAEIGTKSYYINKNKMKTRKYDRENAQTESNDQRMVPVN